MMQIKKRFLNWEKQGQKCPFSMIPEYITIHEIKSNQSADTAARIISSNFGNIGAHFFVDEKEVIQIIPCDRNAFACGDGAEGIGNTRSISIEICRAEAQNKQLYYQSVDNALKLTKELMKQYQIPIEKVVRHYDWTQADCPCRMMRENLWQTFKFKLQEGDIKNEEFSL